MDASGNGPMRNLYQRPSGYGAIMPWAEPATEVAQRSSPSFKRYVEEDWLPNHLLEVTTRQNYTLILRRRIIPYFATMRMIDILPLHIRQFIAHLQTTDLSARSIGMHKTVLDAIFSTAWRDGIVAVHPGRGVRVPKAGKRVKRILTVAEYEAIHRELGDDFWRLLVETDIETGARWGELTELRPGDFDFVTRTLTISRAVVQVLPEFHPRGERFHVKEYPKDGETRRLRISAELARRLECFITERGIGPDELLFSMPMQVEPRRRITTELPDPITLGRTAPNSQGRTYWHGTAVGYGMGRCRCRFCRDAMADYRARRRADGKDSPRVPVNVDTDGHISGDHFRRHIWYPAVARANINRRVTPRHLRDAHASWLLAGGADIYVVKERLGHSSIKTTEIYLGEVAGRDEVAVQALASFRRQATGGTAASSALPSGPELTEARRLLAALRQIFEG